MTYVAHNEVNEIPHEIEIEIFDNGVLVTLRQENYGEWKAVERWLVPVNDMFYDEGEELYLLGDHVGVFKDGRIVLSYIKFQLEDWAAKDVVRSFDAMLRDHNHNLEV